MREHPFSEELIAAVRLSLVKGVGPRLRQNLLARFGSESAVLAASEEALRAVDGINSKLARAIAAANSEIEAEEEIRLAVDHGIDLVLQSDDAYPRLLQEIHDPPGVLFCRGTAAAEDKLAVAIVGTRHATRYGLNQAERLAGGLARAGITVVSGLARGIDAAAHRGALAAGGRTIAVLASGLLKIYPPEHGELADEVAASGCLVSEAPPRRAPLGGAFPQRNRIISGVSLGVIVVEAPLRSGALITAKHANEQGRDVFAVPGPVDSRVSKGTHALLRDGATLVESVDDVLDQLGALVESVEREDGTTVRHPAELKLNEVEQNVLQAISTSPTSIDDVTDQCALPVHRVLSTINVLEMRRLVRRISGTLVARR